MLRQGCRGRPLGWRRVFLLRSGAGMCARRRSNLSLASPPVAGREKVTKEKATPLSVSPSLRYGATCGAPFRRGPRKLASLRCAQTARGPDPPEAVLLGTARGDWAQHPFGPSLRSALASAARAAQAVAPDSAERRHWGRSATVGSRCSAAKRVLRPQSRPTVSGVGIQPAWVLVACVGVPYTQKLQAKMASSAYLSSAAS